ncbi:hypothetical protein [Streptomyces sp. NPDC006193]|uniref:hypothetical protein n=1 Tax=Streptomyces sp. NPDC006193 TaxID=3155717 RepID=UPI0033B6822C
MDLAVVEQAAKRQVTGEGESRERQAGDVVLAGGLVSVGKLMPAASLAVAAALAAGCTSSDGDAPDARHTSSASTASSSAQSPSPDRADHIPGESVTKAPTLPDGEVVAKAVNAAGNRELDIKGGLKAGPLSIMVNCQGEGEMAILVQQVGLSFRLKCDAGGVSSTYNQLNLKHTRKQGTVSVQAPSGVRWALTVGRG